MKIESLIGKNIIDVVLALPQFRWVFRDGRGKEVKTGIRTLIFVDYDRDKPRTIEDFFQPVDSADLYLQTLERTNLINSSDEERCVGLTSKVILGEPYQKQEMKFAHIPMIDFDIDRKFDFMDDGQLQEVIKETIRDIIKLRQGVLLKSSSKRNYHFISTERLFGYEDFITFCGLCLTMAYSIPNGRKINLVDSKHIGHSLTPLKYIPDLERRAGQQGWSVYDSKERFTTLRITPRILGEGFPYVVDVLS